MVDLNQAYWRSFHKQLSPQLTNISSSRIATNNKVVVEDNKIVCSVFLLFFFWVRTSKEENKAYNPGFLRRKKEKYEVKNNGKSSIYKAAVIQLACQHHRDSYQSIQLEVRNCATYIFKTSMDFTAPHVYTMYYTYCIILKFAYILSMTHLHK